MQYQIPTEILNKTLTQMNNNKSENNQQSVSDTSYNKISYNSTRIKQFHKTTSNVDLNIITNNINGLQLTKKPLRLGEMIQQMYQRNIDILLLQELNTNMNSPTIKNILNELLRKYNNLQHVWSHIATEDSVLYHPGGVSIWIRSPMSHHISQRITDPMGRWAGVTLQLKGHQPITILSIYQPAISKSLKGSISVQAQQIRYLYDQGNTTTPRNQFRKDLESLVATLTSENHYIVLGGDFNEHNEENNIIFDLKTKFKFSDEYVSQYNHEIPTYKRSTHMLDRIFTNATSIDYKTHLIVHDYDYWTPSDHRALQLHITFQNKVSNAQSNKRILISYSSKQVSAYIRYVTSKIQKSKIMDRIQELIHKEPDTTELNKLDQQLTDIKLQAEKQLRSFYTGWWHRDLMIWKKELKQCTKQLRNLFKQQPRPHVRIQEVLKEKYNIINKFRNNQTVGFQIRHNNIQQEIKTLYQAKTRNLKKIKYLKSILRNERIRETFRKIRNKTTAKEKRLMSVEVMGKDGKITTITDQENIAEEIAKYNMIHFAQARNTPLAGYKCSTNENNIHQDSSPQQYRYHEHQTSQSISELIYKFTTNIQVPPNEIDSYIVTKEDWLKKFKQWKEGTTTSPSGIHLGHYKVLNAPHHLYFEEMSPEKMELDQQQEELCDLWISFLNIVLKTGKPLDRWKTVHSICLFKDQNNRSINRIRNIHIYEADYNFLLKLKWGNAVKLARKYELLHNAQYGSRKQRNSLDPVLIEIMQQEISRNNHLPYLQINFDAQSCYDRIIPEIAIAISKKHGVHNNILQIFRETLKDSKYYIKLGEAVTTQYYGNTSNIQLFGTGQGSGCSPYIWLLLSSELFKLYTETSQGSIIQAPFEPNICHLHMTAYVDDVNTHHSFLSTHTNQDIINIATQAAQKWSDILYISGGKISNKKSNYYLHQMSPQSTGRFIPTKISHPSICVQDHEEDQIYITNVSTHDFHKSLGYLQSSAKMVQHQTAWLQNKIHTSLQKMITSHLTYKEAMVYYRSIHKPRIKYPLYLSSITQTTAEKMTKMHISQVLNAIGFSSKTPLGIVFGNHRYGGLEIMNISIEQGSRNLIKFAKAFTEDTPVSRLTITAYKWWWFQKGTSKCPLTSTERAKDMMDFLWFKNMKTFITTYKIRVTVPINPYETQRRNDEFIMDLVRKQGYSEKIVNNINVCRLYLQVITLSDITCIKGNYIELENFQYAYANTMNSCHRNGVHVVKPNKSTWHYWQRFLKTITYPNSRRLKINLGEWTVSATKIRRLYMEYRDEKKIYTRYQNRYQVRELETDYIYEINELPENAIPCKTTMTSIIISSTHKNNLISSPPTRKLEWKIPEDGYIIIVSDASVQKSKSAYSWVISDQESNILMTRNERIKEDNITSYRAELIGILSALQCNHDIITKYALKWDFYCDNLAAINQIQHIQITGVNVEQSDSDILYSIKQYTPKYGNFHHVKGHTKVTQNTTLAEKLNILVDTQAKQAITMVEAYSPPISTLKIVMNGEQKFRAESIVMQCQINMSLQYWKQKTGEHIYTLIDWEVFQSISRNFKNEISIIKLLSGLTPTKSHQFKIGKSECPKCPLCKDEVETIHHIIKCSSNPKNNTNMQQIVTSKLQKYGEMRELVSQFLQKIYEPEHQNNNFGNTDQDIIGWKSIWQGKIATSFSENIIPSLKKPKTVRKVILRMLIQVIKQWKASWLHRVNVTKAMAEETENQDSEVMDDQKLQYLYTHKHLIPKNQQRLMYPTLAEHLQTNKRQKRTWIQHQYRGLNQIINTESQKQSENQDFRIPCEAVNENPDGFASGLH